MLDTCAWEGQFAHCTEHVRTCHATGHGIQQAHFGHVMYVHQLLARRGTCAGFGAKDRAYGKHCCCCSSSAHRRSAPTDLRSDLSDSMDQRARVCALLIAVLGSEHALEGHVHLDFQHGAPDREPARDPPVELLLQDADELPLAQLLLLRKEPPQPPRAHSRLWGKRRPALRRWRIRRAPNRQPPQERCALEE